MGHFLNIDQYRHISSQKKNEEVNTRIFASSFNEEGDFYKNLFKLSPCAIVLTDVVTDTIVECNKNFEQLFGYTYNELIGSSRFLMQKGENKTNLFSQKMALLNGSIEEYQSVVKYYKKSGEEFWAEVKNVLVKRNNQCFIMSSFNDVSIQRDTIKALRQQHYQYQQLFNHSINAIAVYDMEKHCYVNCNKPFNEIYGYTQLELSKMSVLELTWNEENRNDEVYYDKRYQENLAALNEMKTLRFESEHKSKEGKKILVDVALIPFKVNGKMFVKQVTTDITEQKLARLKLEGHMREIDAVNASLKEYIESNMQLENFAHITCHDLREPIRSIIAFSGLLEKNIRDELSAENQELLSYVNKAGKKMDRLIKDILAFSKVNNNSFAFETLNTIDILDDVLTDLHTLIAESDAYINIDSNVPQEIRGQKTYLYQLFQNLIKNAIKFRKKDVKPIVNIGFKELEDHYQFSVSDNGIGIDKPFFKQVFELFRKLNSQTKYEGTGIGLAVSKKVVELHNGDIWVESELGQGTSFYFTIQKLK